jgi:hypothetical protein
VVGQFQDDSHPLVPAIRCPIWSCRQSQNDGRFYAVLLAVLATDPGYVLFAVCVSPLGGHGNKARL